MKYPIHRIETYTLPASGSIADRVETYIRDRVEEIVSDLPDDPVLEVSCIPRGDYIEVMIFTGNAELMTRLEAKSDEIRQALRAMGIPSAFYVRTWSGVS